MEPGGRPARGAIWPLAGGLAGFLIGYFAGACISCQWPWPGSNLCGIGAVFVSGPLAAIPGAWAACTLQGRRPGTTAGARAGLRSAPAAGVQPSRRLHNSSTIGRHTQGISKEGVMTDSLSNDRNWNGRRRGGRFLLLVLAALLTGVVAYNAGMRHGATQAALFAAQTAQAQASPAGGTVPVLPPPYPYYYGHQPWGYHGFGGFGFFSPLIFMLFGLMVLRAFAWGGPGRRHWGHRGGGAQWGFDEWHRQAHERLGSPLPAGRPAADDPASRGERT